MHSDSLTILEWGKKFNLFEVEMIFNSTTDCFQLFFVDCCFLSILVRQLKVIENYDDFTH